MGYEHTLSASVTFKTPMAVDVVVAALKPLSDYFGWTKEGMLANKLPREALTVFTIVDHQVTQLAVNTNGDVSYDFHKHVEGVAKNFGNFVVPGFFKLEDHHTGDPDQVITQHWFGDPVEVLDARQMLSWELSKTSMRNAGIDEVTISAMSRNFKTSKQRSEFLPSGNLDFAILWHRQTVPVIAVLDGLDPLDQDEMFSVVLPADKKTRGQIQDLIIEMVARYNGM